MSAQGSSIPGESLCLTLSCSPRKKTIQRDTDKQPKKYLQGGRARPLLRTGSHCWRCSSILPSSSLTVHIYAYLIAHFQWIMKYKITYSRRVRDIISPAFYHSPEHILIIKVIGKSPFQLFFISLTFCFINTPFVIPFVQRQIRRNIHCITFDRFCI